MNTAKTILAQIGNRALTMIGAKDLCDTGEGLQFGIGRNAKKVTKIVIVYDAAADLYNVTYWNIRGTVCKVIAEAFAVYADQLNASIEKNTGMVTRL